MGETSAKIFNFNKIEHERRRLGVSIDVLCRRADMSARSYYYMLNDEVAPRQRTLARLTRALQLAERRK